jgi:ABC-type Fe3+ transport system substrate-binding protein
MFLDWISSIDVILYNTKLVPPSAVPASLADLTSGKFADGKFAVDSRAYYFQVFHDSPKLTYRGATGEAAGLKFAADVAAQKPLFSTSMATASAAVESGQAAIGTGTVSQYVSAMQAHAPVGIAPVSPAFASAYGLTIPPGAPNQPGAELLASWLVSASAEKSFASFSGEGLTTPCDAGLLAQTLCTLKIAPVAPASVADGDAAAAYIKKVQGVLGTSTP